MKRLWLILLIPPGLVALVVLFVVLTIVLILSVWGKGSWLPPFSMGVLLFMFGAWAYSRFSLKKFKQCFFIGICFLPAGFYLLYVSAVSVYSQASFVFGPTTLMHFPSIMLNLSFPVFCLFILRKKIKECITLKFSWLVYISTLLQGYFIVEEGERYSHGNLFWAISYALNILLLVSLIEFVKYVPELSKQKHGDFYCKIGVFLAALHLFGGLAYAFVVYTTQVKFF